MTRQASRISPPGWVGLVALGNACLAIAPDEAAASIIRRVVNGIEPAEVPTLPWRDAGVTELRGPARCISALTAGRRDRAGWTFGKSATAAPTDCSSASPRRTQRNRASHKRLAFCRERRRNAGCSRRVPALAWRHRSHVRAYSRGRAQTRVRSRGFRSCARFCCCRGLDSAMASAASCLSEVCRTSRLNPSRKPGEREASCIEPSVSGIVEVTILHVTCG
jgi:hypothetical protein